LSSKCLEYVGGDTPSRLKWEDLKSRISFNNHSPWWPLILMHKGKVFGKFACLLALVSFRREIDPITCLMLDLELGALGHNWKPKLIHPTKMVGYFIELMKLALIVLS